MWIDLKPSAILQRALLLQYLGGLFCCVYALYDHILFLTATIWIVFYGLHQAMQKYVYLSGDQPLVHFSLKPSGAVIFYGQKGPILRAKLMGSASYLSLFVMVLVFKSRSGRKKTVIVCKDSIPLFAYQRLLAHMRAMPSKHKV